MAVLNKPFGGFFGGCERVSPRATAKAFAVGKKAHKKTGITPLMREVMKLRRDNSNKVG